MKVILVSLAIVSLATPASAGIRYMDRAPIIAITKHRVLVEDLKERRERIRERRREARKARAQAAAQAAAESTPAVYTPTGGSWADELRAVGFPEYAIPTMLYYIDRESGGDPLAINPTSGACGLTQIYPAQPGCLDPMTNLRMAYAKFRASGFAPWGG